MTGAILIETRPERMMKSAWRGEARSASAPNRAMSLRGEPTIGDHLDRAAGEPEGHREHRVRRAPSRAAFSSRVVSTDSLDVLLELGVVEVAAQQVAGAQLADPQLLGRARLGERRERAQLLAPYLQSSAPRRQT